jgi:adenine-specific DNA-methyltransferase
MYPRLKLAQKLLRDDGVIFVSIDDNEQANLKLLMDDVFGEGNFLGILIRKTKAAAKGVPPVNMLVTNHEYLLAYIKQDFVMNGRPRDTSGYSNPDNNPRGPWKKDNMKSTISSKEYTITDPKTGFQYTAAWAFAEKAIPKKIELGEIVFPGTTSGWPMQKVFLNEYKNSGIPILSNLPDDDKFSLTDDATKEFEKLFDGKGVFSYPKPVDLIRFLINQGSDKDSLILDFFAGSATTAHAVMQLNAEDRGNRKCSMVQLDEATKVDGEARKAGYETIDQIARERIKRAAEKIKEINPLLNKKMDLGFRHYKLVPPPANILEKIDIFSPDQLIADDMVTPFGNETLNASGLDVLLSTWVLNDGFSFDTPIQTISFGNYTAHLVSSKLYLISLNWGSAQTKELLNKIGTNEFDIKHIVVYGFSFSFESLRELEINIKNNLDGDHQVSIERRY